MKFTVTGRLGNVKEVTGGYVSFGVAEPSFKNQDGEYVTPWSNFLVKADNGVAKFLTNNASKIDVVCVEGNEREYKDKDNNTNYYHNITNVDVITWKKGDSGTENSVSEDENSYPWSI